MSNSEPVSNNVMQQPGSVMQQPDEFQPLVCSQVGPYRVGLDAFHIEFIETFEKKDGAAVDAAEIFGLGYQSDVERRSLRVRMGAGTIDETYSVVVGTNTHILEVPSSNLQPLPSFLSGLSSIAAIHALVLDEETTTLVLDLNRLRALMTHKTTDKEGNTDG